MASSERATVAETQLRECCAQMERRLLGGDSCRAEEFLAAHPVLADDAESALDLIYTEYRIRSERGETLPLDEYYARFPQWREALYHQFQVHALLCPSMAPRQGKSAARDRAQAAARAGPWTRNPDNFEVLEQIACGSSGVVYKAWQKSPPRVVALKALLCLIWGADDQLARFHREGAAIARLIHPNIVQVYNVSEWEEVPFLVLECVDGGTLAEKWAALPQPSAAVASVLLILARAVEYAHQRGVVHRDLRPGNVLMTRTGEPKITDFGLAKLLVADAEELTLADHVLGTPGYMAPEQAEGRSKHAGAPADVYALGAMLYEGLTGQPPFRGQTVVETLQQVSAGTPVSPGRLLQGIPRDLESICLKCLQNAPERRYGSAAELAEDLRRFLATEPTEARPLGIPERLWRWCRRNPLAAWLSMALTVVAITAFSVVMWQWRREVHAHDNTAAAWTAAVREKANTDEQRRRNERLAAGIFHDQAMTQADHGNIGLAMLLLGQSLEQATRSGDAALARATRINLTAYRAELVRRRAGLPHPDWAWFVVYSPDGTRFVTVSKDRTARLWDSDTGKPAGEPLRHDMPVWAAAFSPDGAELLTGYGDPETKKGGARMWATATGQPLGPPLSEDKAIVSVAFSADGQTLLILDVEKAQLWDRATRKPVGPPLAHGGPVLTAVFSPDGRTVLTGGKDGTAQLWRVPGGAIRGGDAAAAVLCHIAPQGASPDLEPRVVAAAFSPDGRLVATAAQLIDGKQKRYVGGEARVWDTATGKPLGPPLAHPGPLKTIVFSPDNRSVLTGGFVIEGKQKDVFRGEARLWDVDSGRQIGPTLQHVRPVWTAAFSPNGRVMLTGSEDGVTKIWLAATGKNIGNSWACGNATRISVSPDGKTALVGHTYTPASAELLEVPPGSGTLLAPFADEKVQSFVFSGDGKTLATGSGAGKARQWNWTTGEAGIGMRHQAGRCPLVFSRDNALLLTAWERDELQWRAVGSREPVGPSLKHHAEVVAALLSPDGNLLWTRDADRHAYCWETATGKPCGPPVEVGGGPTAAAFRAEGALVATVAGQDVARWEMQGGRSKEPVLHHPADVSSLAFAPLGNLLATGCEDGVARVWNMASGKLQGRPLEHPYGLQGVAFSPNGKLLVTWGVKNHVQIWEVSTATQVSPALSHGGQITSALFSPDSATIAVASDSMVILWDVATGRRLGPPLQHPEPVARLAFDPKGTALATACEDGLVRLFDVPLPAVGEPARVRRWVEVLTGLALTEAATLVEVDADTLRKSRHDLHRMGGEPFPIGALGKALRNNSPPRGTRHQ